MGFGNLMHLRTPGCLLTLLYMTRRYRVGGKQICRGGFDARLEVCRFDI